MFNKSRKHKNLLLMAFNIFLIALFFVVQAAIAEPTTSTPKNVSYENTGTLKNYKMLTKEQTPESAASQFLNSHRSVHGLTAPVNKFISSSKTLDAKGDAHVRMNQTYNNVPVYGAQVSVHTDGDLQVKSVLGNVVEGISVDTTPTVTSDEAINKAKSAAAVSEEDAETIQATKANLYVLNMANFSNGKDLSTYLVWQVELFRKSPLMHQFYFVDAHTQKVVIHYSAKKNSITRQIKDCSQSSYPNCSLDQVIGSLVYGRSEGQPARGTSETDAIYDITGAAHDLLQSTYSRNGANNAGGIGDGVNYAQSLTTVWGSVDGETVDNEAVDCPNAFFDGVGSLFFCSGMGTSDIVGHEYGHAIDFFTITDGYGSPAGLTYQGEPGAISEGWADIYGLAVKRYMGGTDDWAIGAGSSTGVLRDLSNPAAYGQPTSMYHANYYCGGDDYGGVHTNGGVIGYAAYLMAVGGSFNGCSITGIGRDAEEKVLYSAVADYLSQSSTYSNAYTAINSACVGLYGNSATCNQVKKALLAVEMNQGGICSSSPESNPRSTCAAVDGGTVVDPTPTPVPGGSGGGSESSFSVTASTSLESVKTTVKGGKRVYVWVENESGSDATETAYLALVVNGKECEESYEVDVDPEGTILATKFPKVPKNVKLVFRVYNESSLTGRAKMTLQAEKVWTSKNKKISMTKICDTFGSRLNYVE